MPNNQWVYDYARQSLLRLANQIYQTDTLQEWPRPGSLKAETIMECRERTGSSQWQQSEPRQLYLQLPGLLPSSSFLLCPPPQTHRWSSLGRKVARLPTNKFAYGLLPHKANLFWNLDTGEIALAYCPLGCLRENFSEVLSSTFHLQQFDWLILLTDAQAWCNIVLLCCVFAPSQPLLLQGCTYYLPFNSCKVIIECVRSSVHIPLWLSIQVIWNFSY